MKNWANNLDMLKTIYSQKSKVLKGEDRVGVMQFILFYFSCHSRTWFVSPVNQNDPQFLCSLSLFLFVSSGSHQIWNQTLLQFCWQVEPRTQILNNSRMKINWRYQERESTAILMQVCSSWWNAKMQPICPPCSSAVWGHSCSAEKQPYAVSCHDQQRFYCISTYNAQLGWRLLLSEAKKADCCHCRLNPLPYR